MKSITKTSRLAGQLEKLFNMLNEDFFGGQLETPIITIQSTPRAYGHYTTRPIWTVNGEEQRHEINIGAGTLDRDIEYTVGTLLHEMCHMYNDLVLNIQDCSRAGTSHNRQFKVTAEAVGLIVTKTEKYGYSQTAPSDALIEWILDHDIEEIRINRNEPHGVRIGGGTPAKSGGLISVGSSTANHSRKYLCPCCGNSVRATKQVNVICGDCMAVMLGV